MKRFPTPGSALAAALLAATSTAFAAPAPKPVHTLAQAPAGLVAAVNKTMAHEAATDPAYAIGAHGCAHLAANGHGSSLTACFGHEGPDFHTGAQHLGLHLTAWGRTGHLHPVHLSHGAPHGNRIAYQGKGLREWWRVLPMGYEQGFTLDKAPAGHGEVILQLTASAAPTHQGGNLAWGTMRYGKLEVIDAAGHVLPAHLTTHGRTIALTFDTSNARFPVKIDPLVWTQQEITASNGAANDYYGISVALSTNGRTALVGAFNKTVGSNSSQGAAYLYTYDATSGTWAQNAELTASNGATNDQFGQSVALSANGSTALVGAFNKAVGSNSSQGAAYLYSEPSSGWTTTSTQTAELTASNGASGDQFGMSVALSANGSTALVGAFNKAVGSNSAQGAAYLYTEPSSGWATTSTQTAELTASNGATNDQFGFSAALSADGSTALVGAFDKTVGSNSNQGAAYLYAEPSSGWTTTSTQTAELTASNGAAGDQFGYSVALAGNGSTALVGARSVNTSQGAAYLYTEPSSGWTTTSAQAAELTASNGATGDNFGTSVALSADGSTALVGAPYATLGSNTSQGAAYLYSEPSSGWSTTSAQTAELTASNGAANDAFGNSAALSADGGTALVGAYGVSSNQGAAYLLTSPYLSTVLNAPSSVTTSTAYTVDAIVTNNGSATSADLKVQMPVPSGTSYDSSSATQGTCSYDSTTQVATCDLGRLAGSGTMATAQLKLTPTATSGSIAQTAAVYGSPTLSQSATSTVASGTTSSSGSGSGTTGSGSGCGAIGLWTLLALGMMGFVQHRRRQ